MCVKKYMVYIDFKFFFIYDEVSINTSMKIRGEIKMRNLDTPVKRIRHKVFKAVAKIGFESSDETLIHDIESIP